MSVAVRTPRSLDEALADKSEHGVGGLLLAGGTVLVPELTADRLAPAALIDLSRAGLDEVASDDDTVTVGATATYRAVVTAADCSPALAALATVARGITGGPQTRNRATIGGSVAYANPSSDMPAALAALGAEFIVASTRGRRRVEASAFFLDAFRTSLAEDELLAAIRIPPLPPGSRFAYEKLKFGESSWPIATASCVVASSGSARLVIGGCAAVPLVLDVPPGADVAELVDHELREPWSDVLAPASYRRRVAPVVARRAIERCLTAR